MSGYASGIPLDSDLIFEAEDQPAFISAAEDRGSARIFNSAGDNSGKYENFGFGQNRESFYCNFKLNFIL